MKKKPSFFERLTGSVNIDEYPEFEEVQEAEPRAQPSRMTPSPTLSPYQDQQEETEGQLSVDVYQTPDDIVIRAVVAGVRPDNLDISITRDMVTIRGSREENQEVEDDNYFYRELYWGSFSRTILLPQEIEVEGSEAIEKHGLLTIRLPKIDKAKQTKLRVRTS